MTRKKNRFAKAVRAARKGKAVAGAFGQPPKRASWAEEIITLPPPPLPPVNEGTTSTQPESSSRSDTAAAPIQANPP